MCWKQTEYLKRLDIWINNFDCCSLAYDIIIVSVAQFF